VWGFSNSKTALRAWLHTRDGWCEAMYVRLCSPTAYYDCPTFQLSHSRRVSPPSQGTDSSRVGAEFEYPLLSYSNTVEPSVTCGLLLGRVPRRGKDTVRSWLLGSLITNILFSVISYIVHSVAENNPASIGGKTGADKDAIQ